MNISNKRKRRYKLSFLIDLADINKNWNVDEVIEYYNQTGLIVLNGGELTREQYEERRSIHRNEI